MAQEKKLDISYLQYEAFEALNQPDQALLQAAREGLKLSYAPYSKFNVGVAVRLENEIILKGGNQENAAYPMCLCAERVVIGRALSEYPDQEIKALAVTVFSKKQEIKIPASPCGACRQVLIETEFRFQNNIRIIMQGQSGPIIILPSAKSLLPFQFDGSFL